jgi:hypothetical protein
MKNRHSSDLMEQLALRASNDMFFLGNIIAEFKAFNKLSDLDIADYLKCTPDALKRLALCRLPDDREDRFRDDINHISLHVKCNADKLIALIRQVNTLRALRGDSTEHAGSSVLMAARDRRSEKRTSRKHKKSSKDDTENK